MLLHLSVCHSVHRGVCHTPPGQTLLSRHPLNRHAPEQTSPGQTLPVGRHPPWADTSLGRHTPPEQTHSSLGRHPPLRSACLDTVNKRAVRILLECILVIKVFLVLDPLSMWLRLDQQNGIFWIHLNLKFKGKLSYVSKIRGGSKIPLRRERQPCRGGHQHIILPNFWAIAGAGDPPLKICANSHGTRMHSRRMRTARSLQEIRRPLCRRRM